MNEIQLELRACGKEIRVSRKLAKNMMKAMNKTEKDQIDFEEFRKFFILLPAKSSPLKFWATVAESRYPTIDCGGNVCIAYSCAKYCPRENGVAKVRTDRFVPCWKS